MPTAKFPSHGPLWLLAELTYLCPLQCAYCSNPLDFSKYRNELNTDEWLSVLRQAREMGAAQLASPGANRWSGVTWRPWSATPVSWVFIPTF